MFLSLCWITSDQTIHPSMEGLSTLNGIEHTPFRNSGLKVAGLQVHAPTLHFILTIFFTFL